MRKAAIAVGLNLLVFFAPARMPAEPLSRERVPEPLRPWVDWVLHDREEEQCPFLLGSTDIRTCRWPARLELAVEERTGRFAQQWSIVRQGWAPLPGDGRVWPQNVRLDGQPAVVTPRDGVPGVELAPGLHTLSGGFEWDAPPEVIAIPPGTGLLSLSVRGQAVAFPNRDAQGRLWLQKRTAEEDTESRIDVAVHRHIADDVPLLLTTNVQLKVSGKGREVVLGRALPQRFVPMSIDSPLPARIEKDGRLLVQVRPGTWDLVLTARHDGSVSSLGLEAADGPWDAEEVWVFEARPQLRLVTLEGVTAVDPQQTELPEPWKSLPAYLMRPGDSMRFDQKRRGDAEPAPDQLTLRRDWWLDFDGRGFTVRDQIGGSMNRAWRLELPTPWELGRVALGGQDQFITRLGKSNAIGIEIHHGQVQVDADSRLAGDVSDTPAVGWLQDFQRVNGELHLPPGWRLLHAAGVDDVTQTWVSRWTLLDLFVVLIAVLSIARLWGTLVGALALFALGLSYTEPAAPQFAWLAVLAGEALLRVVPEGRFLRLVQLYRVAALALLALIAVPFMVRQVRVGMYPALEYPWTSLGDSAVAASRGAMQLPAAAPVEMEAHDESQVMRKRSRADAPRPMADKLEEAEGGGYGYLSSYARKSQRTVDPTALVQTGPGLPRWDWKRVSLSWRGPVERDQRVRFFFLGPQGNLAAALLRVVLLALLGACAAGWRPGRRSAAPRAAALLFAPLALLLCGATARAEMPTQELLDELGRRLLAPPDCAPACAASSRMSVEVSPASMRARIEVDVAAETGVPLPGGAQHWLPATVVVDDHPAAALMQSADGTLWLVLPAGRHQVLVEGPLPDRDTVQIPLPLKPHRIEARTQGWQLDGLHEDGLAEDSVQLTRVQDRDRAAAGALQQETLPPFVRVARVIHLGLSWQVETHVRRLTPAGSAVVLEVPLLPGESVTTAGIRVTDGKALISIPAQAQEAQWESTLAEAEEITLRAPEGVAWTEFWQIDASSIWHLVADGIPVIHDANPGQARLRAWYPWPGESVALKITRPSGVPGQTFTVDRSVVLVSPGLRSSDVTLDLEIRSSRGAQHAVTLPADSELQSVTINGATQPIRQEKQQVTLPLVPGRQTVQIKWRQRGGIASRFTSPAVGLGIASVNADVRIAVPADRWTLFAGGPRMGPAVLFWSVLVVVLLLSIGLGRVPLTPLRTHQWFLLGVGLTQSPMPLALIVVGWLLALGWRREHGARADARSFDLMQLLLAGWTLAALLGLYWSVKQGLLGLPEMQVSGNGSHAHLLRWYQDRVGATLPRAWVLSVPLLAYRLAMLAWALWLAQALVRWLRWGWDCVSTGGLWRPTRRGHQPLAGTQPPS